MIGHLSWAYGFIHRVGELLQSSTQQVIWPALAFVLSVRHFPVPHSNDVTSHTGTVGSRLTLAGKCVA